MSFFKGRSECLTQSRHAKPPFKTEDKKKRMMRTEVMSSSWLTLDDADDIIHVSRCDFTNVADKLQEDLDVKSKEMDTCTLMV